MSALKGHYGAAELRDLRVGRGWLTAAAVAMIAFVVVAVLVQAQALDSLNLRTTTALQSRANMGQDLALTAFGWLGTIEVTLLLALALTIPLWKGLRLLALLPPAALGVSLVLEWGMKHVVRDLGPPHELLRVPAILRDSFVAHGHAPYTYPSGHVVRSALLYGLVLYLATRWRLFGKDGATLAPVLLFLIFFVGYGRIYLGLHWLSDVLGGLLLAAVLLLLIIGYLERKRQLPPPVRRQFWES
jgi:undecaprenyl-diphosphatase